MPFVAHVNASDFIDSTGKLYPKGSLVCLGPKYIDEDKMLEVGFDDVPLPGIYNQEADFGLFSTWKRG